MEISKDFEEITSNVGGNTLSQDLTAIQNLINFDIEKFGENSLGLTDPRLHFRSCYNNNNNNNNNNSNMVKLCDDIAFDHLGNSINQNDNFPESYEPMGLNSTGGLTYDENGQILNTKGHIEGQNYISGLTESSVTSNVGLESREMAVAPDDILTSRNTKKKLELIRPKLAVPLTKKKSATKKITVPRKRKSSLPKKKIVGSIIMAATSPRNNSERLTSSMVDEYGSLTKREMDVTMDDGNSTVETPLPTPQPQVNNKKRSKEQNITIP